MIATKLLPGPHEPGTHKGTCFVCGAPTEIGHRKPFSDNFTGYAYLVGGDCACPPCAAFFREKMFRFKSFILTPSGPVLLDRAGVLAALLSPPEPPFFLYVTQSHKRQGWLSALRLVNHNRDRFMVSTDFVGHFRAALVNVQAYHALIASLRDRKVSKFSLRTGELTMKQMRLAIEQGWEGQFNEVRPHLGSPLWEVLVHVAE